MAVSNHGMLRTGITPAQQSRSFRAVYSSLPQMSCQSEDVFRLVAKAVWHQGEEVSVTGDIGKS